MKLSFPYGLILLSESGFRLIPPKEIRKSQSVITAEANAHCFSENAFDPTEVEEEAFTHSLITLKQSWSEKYSKKGDKTKKWRVLLPDHWFSFTTQPLPHIGSDYLLSLSSLSIISETIRLAPERLCYGYQCVDDESDLFDIYGCPINWLHQLMEVCGVEIVSISPYSTKTDYSIKAIQALPMLEPYQPLKWWFKKQKRLGSQLLLSSILMGVVGLATLYWLDYTQNSLSKSVEQLQSHYLPLSSPSKDALMFEPLLLSLVDMPPQIRVNTLVLSHGELVLDVNAEQKDLHTLLQQRRQQWSAFEWTVFELSKKERPRKIALEQRSDVTQEVMHARLLVKPR